MKKTIIKEEKVNVPFEVKLEKIGISELTEDMGRSDLNLMRDKINEIIKKM